MTQSLNRALWWAKISLVLLTAGCSQDAGTPQGNQPAPVASPTPRLPSQAAEMPTRESGSAAQASRLSNPEDAAAPQGGAELQTEIAALSNKEKTDEEAMSRTPFTEVFLFFPAKYPEGDWALEGVDKQDAWFTAEDGVKLHGWYFPCPEPRAVVLYAHGNGGNVADWAPAALELQLRLKCAVLLFDYRGYGRSEGVPSANGIVIDGRAARAELARLAQIDPTQIVLSGRSLGGAVVAQLAAEAPARGLILENTFSSYRDVAAQHSGLAILISSDKLNSVAAVAKYRGPLLQSHGDADTIVPLELGRKLFAAAHEPKQFVTVPGGGHNDPPSDHYMHELDRFLDRLPRKAGG